MSIVSNTGPLIALAKADQLSLLRDLFGEVHIPAAVNRELLAKAGLESDRLDAAKRDFIKVEVVATVSAAVEQATSILGDGEQHAICLAMARNTVLLIDERLGRDAARRLGLTVTGSGAVLVRAKQKGLVSHVCPILQTIRDNGYWLSDDLIRIVARIADERYP